MRRSNSDMDETVELVVNLRAYVRRDTRKRWVAVCPAIGVASQGSDADDAKTSLQEAVELWFESCVERGVLDQALRESNFRPLPSDQVPSESEHVMLRRARRKEDVLGDDFDIHVTIPAYQATAFLTAGA
jgi:predicted RNase H-like HicB family nuclease